MTLRKLVLTKNFIFKKQNLRHFSLTASKCEEAVASQNKVRISWNQAVADAIKCVNYQSPFIELSNMSVDRNISWFKNLDRLEQSGHPMREIAKTLFDAGKGNTNQMWGIVTLLVSKLAGYPITNSWKEDDFDQVTGILKSQRSIADYIELTVTGNEFHRDGVLNMQHLNKAGINLDNDSPLIFGNKIAILAGDLMLGWSSLQIAKLKHYKVNALVAATFRDFADSSFIGNS
ncbi:all trans-polyprenyl-diphosphate synthase PDSS2-like [Chironomus tepperi]|uniref:all trans-polyprenyl-diphosphate synthase PDSS2-like n=1 Tax=Chironomus tepperi TaxID=113505 RepID=UPI00391FABD3